LPVAHSWIPLIATLGTLFPTLLPACCTAAQFPHCLLPRCTLIRLIYHCALLRTHTLLRSAAPITATLRTHAHTGWLPSTHPQLVPQLVTRLRLHTTPLRGSVTHYVTVTRLPSCHSAIVIVATCTFTHARSSHRAHDRFSTHTFPPGRHPLAQHRAGTALRWFTTL